MKVGIVTITTGQNYGNRLQNFALQQALYSLGTQPETIWNGICSKDNRTIRCQIKYLLRKTLHLKYVPRVDRVLSFNRFNRKYINWSPYQAKGEQIPENLSGAYDCFVCGSDQIWNLAYKRTTGFDFLSFVHDRCKIAYAASIGIAELSDEDLKKMYSYLEDFLQISVREQQAADLLLPVIKKKIYVMPDPTILIEKDIWRGMEKKPKKHKENKTYILTYFLGGKENYGQETAILLETLRKKYGKPEIVCLEDCYTDGSDNPVYYGCDPTEFLWLIDHAAYIITDSFHGSVFSVLFHKEFSVFERKGQMKMSGRIKQLLTTYGLEGRANLLLENESEKPEIVWDEVDRCLAREREKGLQFLKECIDAVDSRGKSR